jgi:sulfoxide reductase heme-binding subunit YedZ
MIKPSRERAVRWQRLRQRLQKHYLVFAVSSAALMLGIVLVFPSPEVIHRWSIATAYAGLALLGATLVTGPLNLLRNRRNPVSTDLRRDLGIFGAIISLAHVVLGLQVHLKGRMLQYFFYPPNQRHFLFGIRLDLFGFANDTGLIAALAVAFLFALSNDLSLRRLGGRRWKSLQRWNYGLFALVVIHGIAYQLIEERKVPYLIVFGLLVTAVVVIQIVGFRRWKRKPSKVPVDACAYEPKV